MSNETKPVWHSGPPPHVGWWNAGRWPELGAKNSWCWWDGKRWSDPVSVPEDCAGSALVSGWADHMLRYHHTDLPGLPSVYWTDYYPENARVPRVNPDAPPTIDAARDALRLALKLLDSWKA